MASSQPLTNKPPITIAVDPIALVVTECITVTSAMRKHARWAHSSVAAILGGGDSTATPGAGIPAKGRVTDLKQETGSSRSSTPTGERQPAGISVRRPRNAADDEDRWAGRGTKTGKALPDDPLVSAFIRLRNDLRQCKDLKSFDTPALLHPFLQVIRASSTSASITSLALIAVTKFLSYSIINRDSPRLPQAMQLLAGTLTHTRFEASNTSADEIVFLRVLKLMEGMISGPGGDFLSDESMCQIMETALRLCCEARITQMLQRSAEMSMVSMCQVVFERLKHLEIEAGDDPNALDLDTKADMNKVRMEAAGNGMELDAADTASLTSTATTVVEQAAAIVNPDIPAAITPEDGKGQDEPTNSIGEPESEDDAPIKPYSLPSIKELFRTLVELLDPGDLHYTDTMRVMALRMVDVALEVAGPSIANHPSLASLAKDTLCRHLFQLVRSENMAILNESLRVAGTLLATCRNVLKLQQELFLAYLIACLFPRVEIPQEPGIDPRLYEGVPQAPSLVKPSPAPQQQNGNGRATPVPVRDRRQLGLEGGMRKPDAREAMVESIGAMMRMPSFMVDLYVNYDCDIDRSDVCADMIGLLSRNAFPDSATWSTANVPPLCLDALLGFVQSMVDRMDEEPNAEGLPTVEELRAQRQLKQTIIRGSAKFNESPKGGIAYLASQGVIKNPDNPQEIAQFLRSTGRLDKKVLGEFLSKKSNETILNAFMDSFDFTEQRVDEALRQVLYTFRLPGESQLIERIIVEFADKYCANGHPEEVANKDAVYVLTYAIIMLNTDQHNPNLRSDKRMKLEDFGRNLRGVNDGKNFAPEYLENIFNEIKTKEIILPEEHNNKDSYNHAWKELLVKVQSASDLVICPTNLYDADMFAATWSPIVATLSYVFMQATEDAVYQRIFAGFEMCAKLAARYGQSDALDRIIFCLSNISTLAPEAFPDTSQNTEVQVQDNPVMVSKTAVLFGRDYKAQDATVVLFKRVLNGNEAHVKEGWNDIIRILLNLFINSLIPNPFSSVSHSLDMPPIPLQPPAQVIDKERRDEGGLFSTLSSYVSSFTNGDTEPSDQEIEETQVAFDCIQACALKDFFARLSDLPVDTLQAVVTALLAELPEDPEPRVITVKTEAPQAPRTSGTRSKPSTAKYDPKLVFALELSTILALRTSETVKAFGKDVANSLQAVIRGASGVHGLVISRTTYYLLALLRASEDHDFLRVPVLLHTFWSFEPELLSQCSLPLLNGMADALEQSAGLRSEMSTSPDFWAILRALHNQPKAASLVFRILEDLTANNQAGVTADNFEATIALLNDFATAGSVVQMDDPRRNQNRGSTRGKPNEKPVAKGKQNEKIVRGSKAMMILWQITSRVPALLSQSHLEPNEAWKVYWLPILRALATQCLNPVREIRSQAFASLQRVLLSSELASQDHQEWTAIFGEVLFPLIQQLLKPEVYRSDPQGMGETRMQAATLLCKIFLHYLVLLTEWDGMLDLWTRILGVMDRLMNSGQGDNLEEAVPESLKNILLVMSASGYLVPPSKNDTKDEFKMRLWTETWSKLNRFLPGMLEEIFPEEVKKPRSSMQTGSAKGSAPQSPRVASPVNGERASQPQAAPVSIAEKVNS